MECRRRKRKRDVSTSNKDVDDGQREDEKFSHELPSVQESLNQEQKAASDCHLNEKKDRDGELLSLHQKLQKSLSGVTNLENEKRMLETKLDLCQSQLNERDLKIVMLTTRVDKMQKQLCKELEGSGSYVDGAATPFLLETTLKALQTSASSFTKLFLEYSKKQGADLTRSLNKHFENAYLSRPGHVSYLLRAWIFETLFLDFENESFRRGGASVFLNHDERNAKFYAYFQLLESNASVSQQFEKLEDWFEQFHLQKLREFFSLWPADSHQGTTGSLSSKIFDDSKALLSESFRSLAKGVWTLHKLSFSFQTPAEIFRVTHKTEFDEKLMDGVVTVQDDERFVSEVGFMICPGFRLKRSVLKCQIYLAGDR